MIAEHWLAANLPDARPFEKADAVSRAWTTPALFIKFYPYAHQERAAVEAEISSAGLHEAIIPSLLMTGVDDGMILIYPRVSGEPLSTPESRQRFYDQPHDVKHAVLARAFDAYATLTDAGWMLIDLYDGNQLFDATNQLLWVFDWDLCIKAPGITLAQERNYGSSRLMAPEEFQKGAWLDQRTTVFNLGRLAELALGPDPLFTHATQPAPEHRLPTVRAFATAFRAGGLAP